MATFVYCCFTGVSPVHHERHFYHDARFSSQSKIRLIAGPVANSNIKLSVLTGFMFTIRITCTVVSGPVPVLLLELSQFRRSFQQHFPYYRWRMERLCSPPPPFSLRAISSAVTDIVASTVTWNEESGMFKIKISRITD